MPQPPYFSIQLASAKTRAQALALMQKHTNERHIRAELRKSGWQIRVGVYPQRKDAEAARDAFVARGARDARVLAMETAVPWLLPDGKTLPLAVAKPKPPKPAPVEAPAHAPAEAAPAAPAAVQVPAPPLPPARPVSTSLKPSEPFRATAVALDAEIRRWLRVNGPRRRDGFLYGIDVASLMLYAAERGDLDLYRTLQPAARKLIVGSNDEYARGFVVWRQRDGTAPEVSGALETALMGRALRAGSRAFDSAADLALANEVLDGYARHAYELQTFWLVRKYFSFGARSFANLSFVANYQGDLFTEADAGAPAAWRGLGERSYAMLERARAPSGLFYPILQPEVAATYPGLGLEIYGPNRVTPLEDSCTAAEGAVRGRPKLAARVLSFALERGHRNRYGRIHAYFDGESGDPVGDDALSSLGYACLALLSAALDERSSFSKLEPQLLEDMRPVATLADSQGAPLYVAAPMLRAAYAAGAFAP